MSREYDIKPSVRGTDPISYGEKLVNDTEILLRLSSMVMQRDGALRTAIGQVNTLNRGYVLKKVHAEPPILEEGVEVVEWASPTPDGEGKSHRFIRQNLTPRMRESAERELVIQIDTANHVSDAVVANALKLNGGVMLPLRYVGIQVFQQGEDGPRRYTLQHYTLVDDD